MNATSKRRVLPQTRYNRENPRPAHSSRTFLKENPGSVVERRQPREPLSDEECSAVLHADQWKRLGDAMGKNQQSGGFNGQAEGIGRLVGEPEQGNWKPGIDEAART